MGPPIMALWVFVNQVLLYHAKPIHLQIIDSCLYAATAELSSRKKDRNGHKA